MKIHIAIVLAGALAASGCHFVFRVNHDRLVRKHGGYIQLRNESQTVYAAIDQNVTGSHPTTNLPPLLSALNPQSVYVHRCEEPVLNIQTCGGFYHQGLMVVLDTNSTYRPQIGIRHGWVVEEIAPGVFQYRE